LKKSIPGNTLLLFRLGDFYELFNEDARIGSKILGITLTKRHDTPMAGIPHHSAESYIARLIRAGYRVRSATKRKSLAQEKSSTAKSQKSFRREH
jgi:DNA mismatch repair protein MutS